MGCCGAQNLDNLFGSCIRCTIIAGLSSLLFWVIYFAIGKQFGSSLVGAALFGFASIVTLLFSAHLLGHADNVRRRIKGKT